MREFSTVCVDASLVVHLAIGGKHADRVATLWAGWAHDEFVDIVAPGLLMYECANALHQLERAGILERGESDRALAAIQGLDIDFHEDFALSRQAREMARQFSLPATYDAHYLALAKRTNAHFYTLDKRLAAKLDGQLDFVKLIGKA